MRSPASCASTIASAGNVLLTAMTAIPSGSRPARRAARTTRLPTSTTLSRIVIRQKDKSGQRTEGRAQKTAEGDTRNGERTNYRNSKEQKSLFCPLPYVLCFVLHDGRRWRGFIRSEERRV